MSPEILFQTHLVFGYVAWLLCFGVYIWPRLKAMDHTCRMPGAYAAWLEALPDNQRQSGTANALRFPVISTRANCWRPNAALLLL
jgi:hypothetical protein